MMHTYRSTTVALTLSLLSLLPTTGHAETTRAFLRREFRWFDALGFPPVSRLQFVRVTVPGILSLFGSDKSNLYYGFLVRDTGRKFTVFFPDLSTVTYDKSPSGAPASIRIGYKREDVDKWARSRIDAPADRFGNRPGLTAWLTEGYFPGLSDWPRSGLEADAQLFIITRACAGRGRPATAIRLWTLVENPSYIREYTADEKESERKGFRNGIAREMAGACVRRTYSEFGDTRFSPESLLAEFRQIHRRFPDFRGELDVRPTIALLQQMVREGREHSKRGRSPSGVPSRQQCIAELIFQLRGQNAEARHMNPYFLDIFADPRGDNSPAARLERFGIDAVPQLIEALTDPRFTRTSGVLHYCKGQPLVVRVGEVAEAVLERIASRAFGDRYVESRFEVRSVEVQAEAKAWWAAFQERGEQSVLVEAVLRGNVNSLTSADRLAHGQDSRD